MSGRSTRLASAAAVLVTATLVANAIASPARAQQAPSITFAAPTPRVVAADHASPPYRSPHPSSNIGLQVRDAASDQVIRITTDKGTIALGANQTCLGPAGAVVAIAKTGTVNLTFCVREADGLGTATIAAENVTTPGANATTTVTIVGRPAQVRGTASGNSVRVTVLDAAGTNVVNGTPVWFTIPPSTALLPGSCAVTSNGVASLGLSAAEALQTITSGTVIVVAGWNETGSAATCAAAAAQQVSTTVSLTVATPIPVTPVPPVTGTITGGSIPRTGGFGIIVYTGLVTSLAATAGCPVATSAFWTGIDGRFVPYIPGTSIAAVNNEFIAAFQGGIPAGTAIIGKCR